MPTEGFSNATGLSKRMPRPPVAVAIPLARNPDLERLLARRMYPETFALETGRFSLASLARRVAGLILRAAGYAK